jgi:F-box and WD-40 domain protein 1/11
MSKGAAARAAAAAQNEIVKVGRVTSKVDSKVLDFKLSRDSESGIGIDMRDRAESSEIELAVVRIGMTNDGTPPAMVKVC